MSGLNGRVGELDEDQSGVVYQRCVCHHDHISAMKSNSSSINARAILAVCLPAASDSRQPHGIVTHGQLKAIIM